MSIAQMKEFLKKLYPGEAWDRKVDAMNDNQVASVYNRVLNSKNF